MSGYDLGKIQIQDIPIVDVNANEVRNMSQYKKMVNIGHALTKGESYMSDLIDDLLAVFYPTL